MPGFRGRDGNRYANRYEQVHANRAYDATHRMPSRHHHSPRLFVAPEPEPKSEVEVDLPYTHVRIWPEESVEIVTDGSSCIVFSYDDLTDEGKKYHEKLNEGEEVRVGGKKVVTLKEGQTGWLWSIGGGPFRDDELDARVKDHMSSSFYFETDLQRIVDGEHVVVFVTRER